MLGSHLLLSGFVVRLQASSWWWESDLSHGSDTHRLCSKMSGGPKCWLTRITEELVQVPFKVTLWLLRIHRTCVNRYRCFVTRWDHQRMTGHPDGCSSAFCLVKSHTQRELLAEQVSRCFDVFNGCMQIWLSSQSYTLCFFFYLHSCIQFQFLQASCGVPGSVRGLQAPAESSDWWKPNLAWWARTENGRRQDREAAAAAWHRGPAGTEHEYDPQKNRRHRLYSFADINIAFLNKSINIICLSPLIATLTVIG